MGSSCITVGLYTLSSKMNTKESLGLILVFSSIISPGSLNPLTGGPPTEVISGFVFPFSPLSSVGSILGGLFIHQSCTGPAYCIAGHGQCCILQQTSSGII